MKLVLTPEWFLGKDVIIDVFSFIVLLAFFILCWRYYKLSKKKNFIYLGSGFFLIALAQLAAIVTKLVLYYDTTITKQIGQMIVTYHIINSVDFLYYAGFFFHKLFVLIGLYIIYRLPLKKKSPGDLLLAFYFIIISALFGTDISFIFHITIVIFLILIIKNYYNIYKKNKLTNTKILMTAFGLLAFAHFVMIIPELFKNMINKAIIGNLAVVSNFIELISYIVFLIIIIRIFKFPEKIKNS